MKFAVIGAGFTGLTAALDLAKEGHAVTVFEANDQPGGLGAGFKASSWDWSLEHFYHHWFTSDKYIADLISEIGKPEKLFFPTPITSLYLDEKIYPVTPPLQKMLLFPKLSLIPKIRFGFTGLYLRLTKNWQTLEKETAHNWLLKTMGQEAYKVFWEPLLIGKFGRYYKDVNMAWMWARLHVRSVKLGYYQGGFQTFANDLCDYITGLGVDIRFNTKIAEITPAPNNMLRVNQDGDTATFDRVIAAGPPPHQMHHLVPSLPESYTASLRNLKHMGAVVAVLSLKHALTDRHYWINLPKSEDLPFLALVEHTHFVDRKHYGGDHIVYCGDYLEPDHDYFSMSKEDLLTLFLPALEKFNPNFNATWVKDSWLFRAKYAQPIPHLNHSRNIPPLETPVPGLFWASMSHVYPWDRGTNFAVELGHRVARAAMYHNGS